MTDRSTRNAPESALTDAEREALDSLRDRGFAVSVFNPDELKGACSSTVEDRMVESGWEAISFHG